MLPPKPRRQSDAFRARAVIARYIVLLGDLPRRIDDRLHRRRRIAEASRGSGSARSARSVTISAIARCLISDSCAKPMALGSCSTTCTSCSGGLHVDDVRRADRPCRRAARPRTVRSRRRRRRRERRGSARSLPPELRPVGDLARSGSCGPGSSRRLAHRIGGMHGDRDAGGLDLMRLQAVVGQARHRLLKADRLRSSATRKSCRCGRGPR